jgi:single-stranded-DNA-specific exonuclease
MPSKHWILPEQSSRGREQLAAALKISPFVAHLLLCRGIGTEAEARRFLEPKVDHLHDPFLLPDAQVAVERIARAIKDGEKILVHGDYDVDGVCAAALMTRVLRVLKANVEPFVPHRQVHGYDLREATVRRVAAEGVSLIITVDCGIVAFEAAKAARAVGVDLIITDHHEPHPDGELPDALAVVNPKRPDSDYPFQELCGAAVAFKLCCALVTHLNIPSGAFQTAFLDLVALATSADCMPLIDENRIFVKWGLETLRNTNKAGFKALMRVAGLTAQSLNARSLGFALGPRINAIGRMDASEHALQLLLTGDAAEADMLAERLDQANRERQVEQERIFSEAMRQTERFLEDRILVLASEKWHPGIIGIVASKITEALCRPTVMIAINSETGAARGSCRSVDGFHIFEALNSCRDHLERCGGHQAAAGFDINPANIDAFRAAMQEYARFGLDEELLQPTVRVDDELPVAELDLGLARQLSMLEPYGHGNHEPIFVSRGLRVLEQRRLQGKNGNGVDHLKLRVQHPGVRQGIDALFWRAWQRAEECPAEASIDACFTVEVSTYNGNQSVQLNLKDLRVAQV